MERQLIFDQVVAHARTQGRKAVRSDKGSACLYRAPNGDKCFMGVLIPDNLYAKDMEDNAIDSIELDPVIVHLGATCADDENFLMDLQNIHDDEDVEEWEDSFKQFAGVHNLVYVAP